MVNRHRGEFSLRVGGAALWVRPSFGALVAAEGELGSLYALVERAAAGGLTLVETVALLWHCLAEPGDVSREQVGEAVVALGLAQVTPVVAGVLGQVVLGAQARR